MSATAATGWDRATPSPTPSRPRPLSTRPPRCQAGKAPRPRRISTFRRHLASSAPPGPTAALSKAAPPPRQGHRSRDPADLRPPSPCPNSQTAARSRQARRRTSRPARLRQRGQTPVAPCHSRKDPPVPMPPCTSGAPARVSRTAATAITSAARRPPARQSTAQPRAHHRGRPAGHPHPQSQPRHSREFVDPDGAPPLLSPASPASSSLRHRPGHPLIDAQKRRRRHDPTP